MAVTATGLDLHTVGGIELTVDGAPVEAPHHVRYRGMMLDGVPNLAFAPGSVDAPWTLTAELVSDHVAQLVAHMEEHGYTAVTPKLRSQPMETSPAADMASDRVQEPDGVLLSQGNRAPWGPHRRAGQNSAFFCRTDRSPGTGLHIG